MNDSETAKVIVVNQFGERRENGKLDQADDLHTSVTSLDHERAILLLDNNDTSRAYLLTPDSMQKIKLPGEPFYFNAEFAQTSRAIIAVQDPWAEWSISLSNKKEVGFYICADGKPFCQFLAVSFIKVTGLCFLPLPLRTNSSQTTSDDSPSAFCLFCLSLAACTRAMKIQI